jgi:ABC-type phosphate transport system permease subunit
VILSLILALIIATPIGYAVACWMRRLDDRARRREMLRNLRNGGLL